MTEQLPLIGAAMPSSMVPEYRDWLLDGNRDLEIQDPVVPAVLDGDHRSLAQMIRDSLPGYTGRLPARIYRKTGCSRPILGTAVGSL